jgi:hypothetical protein
MDSLKLYWQAAQDKITQLRLFFIFQTATSHLLLEDLMGCYIYMKKLIRSKPRISMLKAIENFHLMNLKEESQVY